MDGDSTETNQRNFRRLVLSVKASHGALNLIVAICDNSRYRDELIAAYEAELSAEGVDCYRVTIDHNDPSLQQSFLTLVSEKGTLSDRPCIVTALGADDLLDVRLKAAKSVQKRFLLSLQWTIKALRDFKVPIVIWVSSSMANMLASSAPDFWNWRTGPFEFEQSIEYQPLDRLQQSETRTYSGEPITDPFEIEQQITILLADDSDSPLLRSLYQSLGIAYQRRIEQGKAIDYAQEQQLGIEALNKAIVLQEAFGETLELADSLNTLAEIYRPIARYQEAEELLERAIAIRTKNLGRNHPDIVRDLNNLARIYKPQGKHDDAELLYVEALKIRKGHLGDRHPDTVTSLNNLAELYESMKLYKSAKSLYLKSLKIRKKQLGDRHPDTVTSLDNLVGLYYEMGRYESAKPLCLESLKIRKEQLGDRHLDTAENLSALALLYYNTYQNQKALPLIQEAIPIYIQTLGIEHMKTQTVNWYLQSIEWEIKNVQIPSKDQNLPIRSISIEQRRAIAYSMDTLIPGLYLWFHSFHLRIGGRQPEASYPGTIYSPIGIAIVLPGYRIFTTYQDSHAPRR